MCRTVKLVSWANLEVLTANNAVTTQRRDLCISWLMCLGYESYVYEGAHSCYATIHGLCRGNLHEQAMSVHPSSMHYCITCTISSLSCLFAFHTVPIYSFWELLTLDPHDHAFCNHAQQTSNPRTIPTGSAYLNHIVYSGSVRSYHGVLHASS